MSNSPNRSYEKIERGDLVRLFEIAKARLDEMLSKNSTGHYYSSNDSLMACLCQGAARHYLYDDRGVHDWDVLFFFAKNPKREFPPRWRGITDYGPSKFGVDPDDGPEFKGRRVDIFGRDIPIALGQSNVDAIVSYLRAGRSESAQFWARKPLIALAPRDLFGQVIWRGTDSLSN